MTHKVGNKTLRHGEETGGLRKDTAELNSKKTGLTKSMDNVAANRPTELTKLMERMHKIEAEEGTQTTESGDRQTWRSKNKGTFGCGWRAVANLHHLGGLGDRLE